MARDPEQHRIKQRARSAECERKRKEKLKAEQENTLKNRNWLTRPLTGEQK